MLIFLLLLVVLNKNKRKSIENAPILNTTVTSFKDIQVFDWSPDGTRLLGQMRDENGVYQVYTWNTEGKNKQSITLPEKPGGPNLNCHKGFPHYDSSGRYIIMSVEMNFNCPKNNSAPGIGASTNVWIYDLQNNVWTNLTNYPFPTVNNPIGTLSPYFSHDGKKIVWAKLIKAANYLDKHQTFGTWELHIADFVGGNRPSIINDTVISFNGGNLYEPHGFSPDDNKILFSSDIGIEYSAGLDIFIYDLRTKELKNLTNSPDEYDEHARFSPNGTQIAWGSTKCCSQYDKHFFLNTLQSEAYIMNIDGTDSKQVTNFNSDQSAKLRMGNWVTAWSTDGKKLIIGQQVFNGNTVTGSNTMIINLGSNEY